jgi:spermidine/putrescine transport system substrate-binding protein
MKKFSKVISLAAIAVISTSLLTGCKDSKSSEEVLNIYNVGDYINEDLIDKFEKETGIEVVYETYDTNEMMYQKLQGGSTNYDLIVPSDYMIEKLIKEDMVQEIDFNNIPNYKNIDDNFKKQSYDKDDKYSVPYMWGTFGILYNKTMVSNPVESWDILWDKKYEGEILMLDSVRDSMGIALKKLGYSMNSINPDEIQKAQEELIKQKPLVLAYVNDEGKDRLLAEEAAMGIVYSGDAVTLMEQNENLQYIIPKEGTNKWIDAMCIPNNAQNKKEAELFINFMLDPQNSKENVDYIGYSTPNKATLEILDDSVKNNKVAYPSDEIIRKSESFIDLGDKLKLYDDAWLKIKSE